MEILISLAAKLVNYWHISTVMRKLVVFYILLLYSFALHSQNLNYSISSLSLPSDTENIAVGFGDTSNIRRFSEHGYQKGDTVNDFNLYTQSGELFHLKSKLQEGKPLVLISSSYSCNIFRSNVPDINEMLIRFKDSIILAVVLTAEAHPDTEASPYFGYVQIPMDNKHDQVCTAQPRTYGERKNIVDSIRIHTGLKATIILDDVCNSWLSMYGPAPNIAYLIGPGGTVIDKHDWFNRPPFKISYTIDSLFGREKKKISFGGRYYIERMSSIENQINSQKLISAQFKIANYSDQGVNIGVRKMSAQLPRNWTSYICTSNCSDTGATFTTYYLEPHETGMVSINVQPTDSSTADTAWMQFELFNVKNKRISQRFQVRFAKCDSLVETLLIEGPEIIVESQNGGDQILLKSSELPAYSLTVYSMEGLPIMAFERNQVPQLLDSHTWPSGLYIFIFERNGSKSRICVRL